MKKILSLFLTCILSTTLFQACAHYHPSQSYIDGYQNYIDDDHYFYSVKLNTSTPLNEYGYTEKEWQKLFGNTKIYIGISKGNGNASSDDVVKRLKDAIAITGSALGYKYAAVYDEKSSVTEYNYDYTTYSSQEMKTKASISTDQDTYHIKSTSTYSVPERYSVSFTKPAYTCRIIFFNTKKQLKILRKVFQPKVYSINELLQQISEHIMWG
ncbi:hypothetical protein [Fibrobacter sp.]|uniref:hypothetical protein n=1 Tax=Fibrobacter sp. TaxID=35828 RepID=UPI00388D843E